MKSMKVLSALSLVAAAGAAQAAAPTLKEVLDASGVTATGYVAASYTHFSTDSGALHQFDTDHNSFQLNQAALTLSYLPAEGFGASVFMIAGNDAGVINGAGGTSGDLAIPSAFVQYKSGGFTLMAGRLLTMAGAEVMAANGNSNFSRGLLFTNLEPLMHTGVRAQFAASDAVTFTVGVNNGWNAYSDNNTQKTIEGGVSYAPMKSLSFALNGYFGNESPTLDQNGNPIAQDGSTTLIDFVTTWSPLADWTFVLNYDNLRTKDSTALSPVDTLKSDGIAVYANWAINDTWRSSLRLEQIKNKNFDSKVKEATLTVGYMPAKSAEFDFEIRKDKSSSSNPSLDKLFTEFGTGGQPTANQTEFAVQALYKF